MAKLVKGKGWFFIALFLIVGSVTLLMLVESRKDNPGEVLYVRHCASCHMEDGSGLGKVIPPLAQADFVELNQTQLACIIRNGMEGPVEVNGVVYNQPMAGNEELTIGQITNIINYINSSWGNDYGMVTVREVGESLAGCEK